jgi:hypothetical protein
LPGGTPHDRDIGFYVRRKVSSDDDYSSSGLGDSLER